jgi:N-acetylneuraminic acid mutarotase
VLLGGLTAADTSSDAVTTGDLAHAANRAALPNAQHDAQAANLDGRVYVFGGGQYSQYDHILAYDPQTNSVTLAGRLPAAASDVAVAGDGRTAYVVGGFDGVHWLNTVVAYRPGTAPRVVARLPVALRYAAAAVTGSHLLIAGGSTPGGASRAIYRFDPRTGALTTAGRLPAPITHAAAGVIGSTMYLIGGRGDLVTSRRATIYAIDPATGRVRQAGRLPFPLSDAAVISLGGRLVVAGGSGPAGTQAAVGELTASR